MTEQEVFGHVDHAIKTVLNNPSLKVTTDAKLIDDLGIESIDLLDISSELEKSVGRELDFKELTSQASAAQGRSARDLRVSDLVTYLHGITANA